MERKIMAAPRPVRLTEAQEREFSQPSLRAIAERYLRYVRSSPYGCKPANKRKYFAAPPDSEMTDSDAVYGGSRDDAYAALMCSLRDAQRDGSLRALFDERHNIYYESATIPGLVLLAAWAYEDIPKPGVYVGYARDISADLYGEIWVVSTMKASAKDIAGNIRRKEVLSPTQDIDKIPDIGEFKVAYIRQMLSSEAKRELTALAEISGTKPVLLVQRYKERHAEIILEIVKNIRGES